MYSSMSILAACRSLRYSVGLWVYRATGWAHLHRGLKKPKGITQQHGVFSPANIEMIVESYLVRCGSVPRTGVVLTPCKSEH